jgi:hypothetical protein
VNHSAEPADEDPIRQLVMNLSRPHPTGGKVIERAAILAEGTHADEILAWLAEHGWEPEAAAPAPGGGQGLHGRTREAGRETSRRPLRYVLPPGAAPPS